MKLTRYWTLRWTEKVKFGRVTQHANYSQNYDSLAEATDYYNVLRADRERYPSASMWEVTKLA